ncbi:MAG: 8-amino-7-oxononanoate synthase [Pseudomonadales bacterium]|nr:8-amino-7-oxononanoate synthase [Pseudomonadales bacterium]
MTLPNRLAAFVEQRKQQMLYRSRRVLETPQGAEVIVDGRPLINFSSNDYLGLANHPRIAAAFKKGIDDFGVGSGASHLVIGHSSAHYALEEQLADFVGCERALLYSSGYMANVGAINALTERGDIILQDKLNHASLLDGGLLSSADMKRYNHCDTDALALRLQKTGDAQALVVSDAVFSMDGDIAPINKLAELCDQHQAMLMIDDAHGFGVLGDNGKGALEHFSVTSGQVPIYMATLGKAAGVSGAFVAGEDGLIDYLIQSSRNYIYTTAIPPANAVATSAALLVIEQEKWRREHLTKLISQFRSELSEWESCLMPSDTAIQPLIIGDANQALTLSDALLQRGFLLSAIRPPTVPANTARLRITLTAAHTETHISQLTNVLKEMLPSIITKQTDS